MDERAQPITTGVWPGTTLRRTSVRRRVATLALATLTGTFDRARGRRHETEVRRLKMKVEILKNDLPAAMDEGLAALRAYDIHLPPYPDDGALAAELARTLAIIGDRPIASLVDLPALDDPEIAALQDLLQEMFSPTYQLGTNNFGITVMKALQGSLTITYLREGARVASIRHYLKDSEAQPHDAMLPLRILLAKHLVERNGGRFAMDQSHPEKDILRLEFPIG